jgi:hypothetical protein
VRLGASKVGDCLPKEAASEQPGILAELQGSVFESSAFASAGPVGPSAFASVVPVAPSALLASVAASAASPIGSTEIGGTHTEGKPMRGYSVVLSSAGTSGEKYVT